MSVDHQETAYATLRFMGDDLDPHIVTRTLGHEPTLSYRKGEIYRRDRRGRELVGRSGLWLLSTKTGVSSCRLQDHINVLASVLAAKEDLPALVSEMVRNHGYEADASCFWYGPAGAAEPEVPASFRDIIGRIGGEIWVDFHRDDDAEHASERRLASG